MDSTTLRNFRLQASAIAVVEYLEDFDMSDIIFNIYLPVKDEDTKKLITFYEEQLVLAKSDKDKFIKLRPKMMRKVSEWIHKNKKWQLFADFLMYVQRNLDKKPNNILYAYLTSMIDTWAILAPWGKYWYGIENGRPLFTKELYPAYDEKVYELALKIKSEKSKLAKEKLMLEALIHDAKIKEIQMDERNITNVIFSMIGLINTENQKFIYPFDNWFNHYNLPLDFPRQKQESQFYLDMLGERSFLLASEGVSVKCFNAGELFKEIRFKEEFLEDGMILLFRITNIFGKHTMGFIDLRDKYTYCLGKHSDKREYNDRVINFVLEVYCHLTCEFNSELLELKKNDIVDITEPAIYCEVYEPNLGAGGSRKVSHKALHKVKPFLRRGNASEMAKAKAKLLGLYLPQGYTFVSEHIRGHNTVSEHMKNTIKI